jgi:3,4-dihydroxy 2-butanone 4-phosphate synthase / GTP cyclohydrolase II
MTNQEIAFAEIQKAIDTIREGHMVIMVDDEDRENEGDLVFAAEHVTDQMINFMTKEARGLICLTLDEETIDRLELPMMEDSTKPESERSTAFTVSIEAREGVTTGISAADRAQTVRVAVKEGATSKDISVPGHIFPLKARPGGCLERAGHTEGSVDIARLAGMGSSAVICEIMNDDGTMARMPDLEIFSKKHNIPIITIADLITFRLMKESLVTPIKTAPVKTQFGTFSSTLFKSEIDGSTHLAITKGDNFSEKLTDIRVHSQRQLIDVFSHEDDGGRFRVNYGLKMLEESDSGVFLYMTQSEGSNNLISEFDALTDAQADKDGSKNKMNSRMLGIGSQILKQLGVKNMRVHMASPRPLKGLAGYDLNVIETQEIIW